MGPVYRALGLTVNYVGEGMTAERRRAAYAAAVTYVTARQAGFDWLRDSLAQRATERVHRGLDFAIVDEADFILIDEARVPLVLAVQDDAAEHDPGRVDSAVEK